MCLLGLGWPSSIAHAHSSFCHLSTRLSPPFQLRSVTDAYLSSYLILLLIPPAPCTFPLSCTCACRHPTPPNKQLADFMAPAALPHVHGCRQRPSFAHRRTRSDKPHPHSTEQAPPHTRTFHTPSGALGTLHFTECVNEHHEDLSSLGTEHVAGRDASEACARCGIGMKQDGNLAGPRCMILLSFVYIATNGIQKEAGQGGGHGGGPGAAPTAGDFGARLSA